MSEVAKFLEEVAANVERLKGATELKARSRDWLRDVADYRYSYNFTWLGRPIIQVAQDIVAMQELVWRIRPELVVETGVAHGGSLIFYASMLELLGGGGRVLGIDIDIRAHNRLEIERHPMARRIDLLEGSSIAPEVVREVQARAEGHGPVLVVLDSNHTHDHVLQELRAYAPLVSVGSYVVVFDTAIEDLPADRIKDRPWGPGNSPKTAVASFLAEDSRFEVDDAIDAKLLISVAPGGYLKRVRN
jgi:cephalosporin hydroxylase